MGYKDLKKGTSGVFLSLMMNLWLHFLVKTKSISMKLSHKYLNFFVIFSFSRKEDKCVHEDGCY